MKDNLFNPPLPDLIGLNTELHTFLGPLAPLVITMLNGMAFLIIMLLVVRLSIIAIKAILVFNDEKLDHAGALSTAIRSGVEAFLIALAGFLVISAGPNLLYYFATSATTGLLAKETDYLPSFAGPFAGLVAAAQNVVSLGVVILGVFFGAKIWYGALAKADYAASSGSGSGQMGALNDAAKRTAVLALLVIMGFALVLKGPQLFFSVINGGSGLINNSPILK